MAGDRPKFPDYGKPDRTTMEMGMVLVYDTGNSRQSLKIYRFKPWFFRFDWELDIGHIQKRAQHVVRIMV